MYSAEISRKNPGCFIFLLDQSASMEDPFGGSSDRRKADELATIINKLLHNLSIRCAKGDSIYDYFHVAVIGYGQDSVVKSAFDGAALVFNLPLSSAAGTPIELPASDDGLPDKFAKQLFEMSSNLTPFMISRAQELGMPADEGARGFVFNAQPVQIIQFLDIGTRPANLR